MQEVQVDQRSMQKQWQTQDISGVQAMHYRVWMLSGQFGNVQSFRILASSFSHNSVHAEALAGQCYVDSPQSASRIDSRLQMMQ